MTWLEMPNLSPTHVLSVFNKIDVNKTGRISYPDFVETFRDPHADNSLDFESRADDAERVAWGQVKPRVLFEAVDGKAPVVTQTRTRSPSSP